MRFLRQWRAERLLQRRALQFVERIGVEPEAGDVAWLAATATRGDEDHARWELRYARAAIGLLVAQRDALDDRTASVVGRALSDRFERDERIAGDRRELAERQFNARLSAYRDAFASRGAPARALPGQTLLAFAGGAFRGADEQVARASAILALYEREANEALRAEFGAAALPENVAPSALLEQADSAI